MDSASKILGARRYSPTNTKRSKVPKANLFGDLRRSTLLCCRRTRISASSRALERNKRVSADHSSMRTSTTGHKHHPIRHPSPTVYGFRQGQEVSSINKLSIAPARCMAYAIAFSVLGPIPCHRFPDLGSQSGTTRRAGDIQTDGNSGILSLWLDPLKAEPSFGWHIEVRSLHKV